MYLDILIPYWGDPALMRETVASVLAQDDPSWRLTVIDDAYPGTEIQDHLEGIGDDRISYVRKNRNEGIIANFRSCVAHARSPIMAMPGCDDRLLPTYVGDVLAAAARFPSASIIQPGVQVIDDEGNLTRTVPDLVKEKIVKPRGRGFQILSGERLAVSLLHGDWLYWPSLAFRTDRIQATPFREEYSVILDLALILDLVFEGDVLVTTPEVSFEYRRHARSLSSTKLGDGSRFDDEREYFRGAADQARALGWSRAARAARWHVTSRAYAGLTLPRAVRAGDRAGSRALVRHILTS